MAGGRRLAAPWALAVMSAAMAAAPASRALARRRGGGGSPTFMNVAFGHRRGLSASASSGRVRIRSATPAGAAASAPWRPGTADGGGACGTAPWAALFGGGLMGVTWRLAAASRGDGCGSAWGKSRRAVAMRAGDQSEVSQIDFRVGEIVSAERHPDSEKLLVEMIDIGEGKPRQICSGIAKWFSPEDVTGRRVVIVANLKGRKMAGVASEGMLLCAKAPVAEGEDEDAGELAIVEAPAGAATGERVAVEVEGEEIGEAAPPNRVQKKKLYEKVAPFLCTDGEGQVCFKESLFMTSSGPCTAPSVLKGVVS